MSTGVPRPAPIAAEALPCNVVVGAVSSAKPRCAWTLQDTSVFLMNHSATAPAAPQVERHATTPGAGGAARRQRRPPVTCVVTEVDRWEEELCDSTWARGCRHKSQRCYGVASFPPTSMLRKTTLTSQAALPPPSTVSIADQPMHPVVGSMAKSFRKKGPESSTTVSIAAVDLNASANSFVLGTTPMGSLPPQFLAARRLVATSGALREPSLFHNSSPASRGLQKKAATDLTG